MDLIGPHDSEGESTAAVVRFLVLRVAVADLAETDAPKLRRYLRTIRNKLCPPFNFGPDYRYARWGDQEFTFTDRQAACLAVMDGRGWLGSDYILTAAVDALPRRYGAGAEVMDNLEVYPRFRDLFKGHEAWGAMIVAHPKRNNLFRLAPPPAEL